MAGIDEMTGTENETRFSMSFPYPLKMLTVQNIMRIDRILEDVGPDGEVRLIKTKGRLRFIQRVDTKEEF
jgi:hypothetical protein